MFHLHLQLLVSLDLAKSSTSVDLHDAVAPVLPGAPCHSVVLLLVISAIISRLC